MKNFIFILCLVLIPFTPAFADDAKQLQQERAITAVDLFKKVCFMMHSSSQTDKRLDLLNDTFPKFESPRKDIFLNMFRVKNGDAWAAIFPNGNYVVVVDYDTTNCHLVAKKSDAHTIHEEINSLSKETEKHLDGVNIKYHAPSNDDRTYSSGFDIQTSEGENITIVAASTPKTPNDRQPEALLTVAVK